MVFLFLSAEGWDWPVRRREAAWVYVFLMEGALQGLPALPASPPSPPSRSARVTAFILNLVSNTNIRVQPVKYKSLQDYYPELLLGQQKLLELEDY